MDENDLLRLARRGDLPAFNALVLACQDEAFTLACYLSGDDARACALLDSAVVRAYRGMGDLRAGTFRGWLLGCLDLAWREARPKPSPQPGEAHSRPGDTSPLPGALAGLPADCRLALLLVDLLGLDLPEAAQAARCSLPRLNLLLARARRDLLHVLPA